MSRNIFAAASLALIATLLAPLPALAQATPPVSAPGHVGTGAGGSAATPEAPPPYFARVNAVEISTAQFEYEAREAYRKKFYHGQPPESELQALLRSVGQQAIDKILLGAEINKRQVAPDTAAVEAQIANYEKQYANSENWKAQRQQTLPRLRAYLEEKSREEALEKQIRSVAEPSDAAAKAFFEKNQPLFTEPEKVRVSLILLKVSPSATRDAWQAAMDEGKTIHESLLKGADFAETAKQKSADGSAAKGGDMGYLHRGMLADDVHAQLDKAKPGDLLAPVRILEGVAIFRLTERVEPKARSFDEAAPRAKALLRREQSEQAWLNFMKRLRTEAKIDIHPAFSAIMQEGTTTAN